jgi:MFS family permease
MHNQIVALTLLTLTFGLYDREGKKPSSSNIAGELLAGIAGGIITGFLPAYLFLYHYPTEGQSDGNLGLFLPALIYLPVGYSLGSAIGVYLVGNIGKETGSFLATLRGSLLTGLAVIVITFTLSSIYSGFFLIISIPSILVLVIAPVFIFNSTRRSKLSADSNKTKYKKPPLNIRKIAGELLAGIAGGIIIGSISAFLFNIYYHEELWTRLRTALMYPPIAVGYLLGSAIGVYLVGNIGKETGSFKYTLGGSLLIGLWVFGIIISLSTGIDLSTLIGSIASLLVFVSVPIVIFNLTRRYKLSATSNKL